MIIDTFANAKRYTSLHYRIAKAFEWLQSTELDNLHAGKYVIEDENVFAIVQEYKTLDAANEQMEAHKNISTCST